MTAFKKGDTLRVIDADNQHGDGDILTLGQIATVSVVDGPGLVRLVGLKHWKDPREGMWGYSSSRFEKVEETVPVQPVEVEQVRRWSDTEYHENAGQQFRVTGRRAHLVDYTYLTGPKKGRETWAGIKYVEENSTVVSTAETAPLDPAKVKAGDTVTLEIAPSNMEQPIKPYAVTGEVYEYADQVMAGGWPISNHPSVTLTAHQPAPEPEPEHAPGFYTVHPYDSPETNWTGFVDSEGTFYGEEDGFFRQAFKGDYTVDSRLVVIDPADVESRLNHYLARTGESRTEYADLLGNVFPELGLTR